MSWRFRKRVKIIPGIYLNLSKNGISTTIGPRGFNINIGQEGTYLNTGIPGTGLYNRSRLDAQGNIKVTPGRAKEIAEKLKHLLAQTSDGSEQIKSESIEQLTSPGLTSLKETIIAAHEEYAEVSALLHNRELAKSTIDAKLQKCQKSIFRFLMKKKIARLDENSQILQEEISELYKQLQLTTVDLSIHNDDTFSELYKNVERSYELMVGCSKIWDITTSKTINRVQQRSSADTEVRRVEVKASIRQSGLIETGYVPFKLENKNGGDLYFYPGFVIVHEQKLDFAILDYSEFEVGFQPTRFIESENVPNDTEVVGHTWFKVNKDGSPDRRFSNNFQIPIVKYGQVAFTSPTGVNEHYMVSNSEFAFLFYTALKEYISAIKSANNLLIAFTQ